MQRYAFSALWACILLLFSLQAQAAQYVVAPFKINGPAGFSYLEQAIPSMLSSRLFWQDKFSPVDRQGDAAKAAAPTSKDAASKMLQTYKADYVVWGSVTVLGEEASIDVNVLDKAGKDWQRATKTTVTNLIGGLQNVADAINTDVFERPRSASSSVQSGSAGSGPVITPLNPSFVVNETQGGAMYANTDVRNTDLSRTFFRSQPLDYESRGMVTADLDGDGANEVLILEEDYLYAYRWDKDRLQEIGKYRFFTGYDPLTVNTMVKDGRTLILLNAYDMTNFEPVASILTFANGEFTEVAKNLHFFINVAKLPPAYQPTLIGQAGERVRIFYGSIFEVVESNGTFSKGPAIANLPKEANVLNFTWLPGGSQGGDHLVVLGPQEFLLVFDTKGKRLAKTDEKFSGSPVGIASNHGVMGMGISSEDVGTTTYLPMRMLATDLDANGTWEVLANHPVSMAAQLFSNYRTYPQGEIESLIWDGMGMEISWKTRRIKGSVIDFGLSDPNNDGVLDLVVCVNTYPGTLGTGNIRTMLNIYPLGN